MSERAYTLAISEGFASTTIPLRDFWDFRDDFLSQSQNGREYIDAYYLWSVESSGIDLVDLPLYVGIMPEISAAMATLEEGADETVVIDTALLQEALTIISLERTKTSNSTVLSILDRVEQDLVLYSGLSRSDFLALFNQAL